MHPENGNGRLFARIAVAVLVATLLAALPARAAEIDEQRELFERVYETVERGDWSPVDDLPAAERELLERYVLWPDLRAAWLRANTGELPDTLFSDFFDTYGALRPARELRYRYALSLGRQGRLGDFHRIYERFYEGSGVARLDCLALQSDIDAGRLARVPGRALDLWLVGTSQVDECDPVFAYLKEDGLIGPLEYRKRFALAIESREFQLARWLAKKIDDTHVAIAATWQRAQSDPGTFLENHSRKANSEAYREQLVYAAERLTYRDPVAAHGVWRDVERRYGFSAEQKLRTRRHIALWMARDNLPDGYRLLASLPRAAQDDEVMRWRARVSLRDGKWRRLLLDIDAMDDAERTTEAWRYWHAVAALRSGRAIDARAELEALSKERSYYGFLAADELGSEYAFDNSSLPADNEALAAVANRPDMIRARELFLVGMESRGRSEWNAAIDMLTAEEKRQAAILAHRWGWHSRAIATVSSLGEYDDLEIRYPLPWQSEFESHASAARIEPTWAYGVARSESLFMRDVRSSAGAIGLMQLMPGTGRAVAREIRLPWSGVATLTDPEKNIRLGTSYLGRMAERFGGNHVLATAAYNAGPHRVDEWLPEHGAEDTRAWIENIPFNETRNYVKKVMAAKAIFHWRMTGDVWRISEELGRVIAPEELQLAAR
ncbi:MAG: transglycosylase SLT domain-containing protein [Woeseiaceae bacterium]|nr:transglycosylase SLT domain-containing protein [Woeseiaceae bacterium]